MEGDLQTRKDRREEGIVGSVVRVTPFPIACERRSIHTTCAPNTFFPLGCPYYHFQARAVQVPFLISLGLILVGVNSEINVILGINDQCEISVLAGFGFMLKLLETSV